MIDTRFLLTDSNGIGRYMALRTYVDRLTITDELSGQVMTIHLTMSVEGDNKGDQTASTVPLETTWGVSAGDVRGAVEELSGELGAAAAITYVVRTADPMLPSATVLGELETGIVRNTTETGELVIAIPADFPTLNQDTTGNAATATILATARTINGISFNGSTNITIEDGTKEPANANIQTHISSTSNPHGVTAAQINAVANNAPITVNAAATDPATTMALVNQIRAALATKGIVV